MLRKYIYKYIHIKNRVSQGLIFPPTYMQNPYTDLTHIPEAQGAKEISYHLPSDRWRHADICPQQCCQNYAWIVYQLRYQKISL